MWPRHYTWESRLTSAPDSSNTKITRTSLSLLTTSTRLLTLLFANQINEYHFLPFFLNLSFFLFFCSQECFQVQKGQTFYDFFFNTRLVKSTIVHFQVKTSFILACYVVDSGTFGRIGVIHLGCYAFYCYMSGIIIIK